MDHAAMKLGKAEPKLDPRTLRLSSYLNLSQLPVPPRAVDYGNDVCDWQMYMNDTIGDCTCAAAGHMLTAWSHEDKEPLHPTDQQILAAYEAISGYDPAKPESDTGAVELTVLNYWRNTGIADSKLGAYVAVNPRNIHLVQMAIYLFGGIYIGLALPLTAQNQKPWHIADVGFLDFSDVPGSWGGHAVNVVAYDEDGLTCITWGEPQKMTWEFFTKYCDEAYALISPTWFGKDELAPNGFNVEQLQADLAALGGKSGTGADTSPAGASQEAKAPEQADPPKEEKPEVTEAPKEEPKAEEPKEEPKAEEAAEEPKKEEPVEEPASEKANEGEGHESD